MQTIGPYRLLQALGTCQVGGVWSAADAVNNQVTVAVLSANAARDQGWRDAFAAAANGLAESGKMPIITGDFSAQTPWIASVAGDGSVAAQVFVALGMAYQPLATDSPAPGGSVLSDVPPQDNVPRDNVPQADLPPRDGIPPGGDETTVSVPAGALPTSDDTQPVSVPPEPDLPPEPPPTHLASSWPSEAPTQLASSWPPETPTHLASGGPSAIPPQPLSPQPIPPQPVSPQPIPPQPMPPQPMPPQPVSAPPQPIPPQPVPAQPVSPYPLPPVSGPPQPATWAQEGSFAAQPAPGGWQSPYPEASPYGGPPAGPGSKPPRRRTLLIVGVVLLALVVLGGGSGAIAFALRSDNGPSPPPTTPTPDATSAVPGGVEPARDDPEQPGLEPPTEGEWPDDWPAFDADDEVQPVTELTRLGLEFEVPADWGCTGVAEGEEFAHYLCGPGGDSDQLGGEVFVRGCPDPCDASQRVAMRRAEEAWGLRWTRDSGYRSWAETEEIDGEERYGLVIVGYWRSIEEGRMDRQVVFRMTAPVDDADEIRKVANSLRAAIR